MSMMKISNFDKIYKSCYGHGSLIDRKKAEFIYDHCESVKNLPGNTAELGVYFGDTSKMIMMINPTKKHYCYDTFKGVVKSQQGLDLFNNGEFKASFETVKNKLKDFPVEFKIGIFPETFSENEETFSFVHSDLDTYFGVKATYECFKSKMVKGGKILFDDFDASDYRSIAIRKAINELMLNNLDFKFEFSPKQVCFIKI